MMYLKIKNKIQELFEKNDLKQFLNILKNTEKYFITIKNTFYILVLSYVAASIINLVFLNIMTKYINLDQRGMSGQNVYSARVDLGSKPNYNRLIEAIISRNIFNAEGKYPEEKTVGENESLTGVFDENGPCSALSLPLTVQGVLLMNSQNSLVVIREPSYSEADVYSIGDSIIGNDSTIIHSVDDEKVVFNNGGKKECVFLFKPLSFVSADGDSWDDTGDSASNSEQDSQDTAKTITLRSDFVEKELGPGFSNAISSARFVPNISVDDGSTQGFKVFSIRGGSLFSQAGLQDGDIIKSVNDTSLQKAEQGFALYEAFQNEREIRIQLTRSNKPVSLTVRVVQ